MAEDQAPVLQPIRANICHFKKPWFDCVEVRRIGAGGQEETAYAELRLLFEADILNAGQWAMAMGTLGITSNAFQYLAD